MRHFTCARALYLSYIVPLDSPRPFSSTGAITAVHKHSLHTETTITTTTTTIHDYGLLCISGI